MIFTAGLTSPSAQACSFELHPCQRRRLLHANRNCRPFPWTAWALLAAWRLQSWLRCRFSHADAASLALQAYEAGQLSSY